MIINKATMDEINAVQYEIFKSFHNVCVKLNLRYYLVHGSLLGALRYKGFFPFDDDIDVAMPRKDYNIFIREGQKFFSDKYFVQSHLSERDYPIVFCKVRDNETAFIQPVLERFNVNQGIYIDVFPIDNYPVSVLKKKYLKLKGALLSIRVNRRLNPERLTINKNGILQLISSILFPSWKIARDMYCDLYNSISETGDVIVRGGKCTEVGISFDYFGKGSSILFENINSFAPAKTDSYLNLIYGDYINYAPMGKDMVSDSEVKISASIVDVHKSYKDYLKLK